MTHCHELNDELAVGTIEVALAFAIIFYYSNVSKDN
jgi:hypothetical protein